MLEPGQRVVCAALQLAPDDLILGARIETRPAGLDMNRELVAVGDRLGVRITEITTPGAANG